MISLKWCNDGVKPSFQPSRECRWWHYYFATSSKFHIYKVKQTTCCNSKQKFTYVYHWSTINIPKKLFIFTTMEICSTWGLDCFFKLKNRVCCGLLSALYFGPKVVCWWMTGISLLSVNNWDQGRTSVVISFSYSWSMTQSYCLLYFFAYFEVPANFVCGLDFASVIFGWLSVCIACFLHGRVCPFVSLFCWTQTRMLPGDTSILSILLCTDSPFLQKLWRMA